MAVIRVTTQTELDAAVRSAQGGDTIQLASGTYDRLRLINDAWSPQKYAQTLTITSEDPSQPAVIREMPLRGAENILISNLVFDYDPSKTGSTPFVVEGAKNITISDSTFIGETVSGFGKGIGLRVKNSQNITLNDSEIYDFRDGLNYSNSSDITVSGNTIRGVSNDGLTIGGITRILVEDNEFRDFKSEIPGPNHKDAIQFRAGPTSSGILETPLHDVIIRNNTFNISEVVQAIYGGNETYRYGDNTAFHENITITGNYIRTAHLHGITVLNGKGVAILDNTLVQNPDGGYSGIVNMPIINVSLLSEDVEIRGNTVASVQKPAGPTWVVEDNDVGTRRYLHWAGIYTTDQSSLANSVSVVQNAETETIRVKGSVAAQHPIVSFTDLDFLGGDTLTFTGWDKDTFKDKYSGNPVDDWAEGASVRIDSLMDIRELDAFSPDVSAWSAQENNSLIVRIDQNDGKWAIFLLEGLGAAYAANYDPGLF